MQITEDITVDDGVITIYGIKYALELFRDFANGLEPGVKFSIIERRDGVLAIERHPQE